MPNSLLCCHGVILNCQCLSSIVQTISFYTWQKCCYLFSRPTSHHLMATFRRTATLLTVVPKQCKVLFSINNDALRVCQILWLWIDARRMDVLLLYYEWPKRLYLRHIKCYITINVPLKTFQASTSKYVTTVHVKFLTTVLSFSKSDLHWPGESAVPTERRVDEETSAAQALPGATRRLPWRRPAGTHRVGRAVRRRLRHGVRLCRLRLRLFAECQLLAERTVVQ